MGKKSNDGRGKAGGEALKLSAQNKIKENKNILLKTLRKFKDEKVPIIKTELSQESGLSIATLNRSPYKDIIAEFMDEEKGLLSPKGKQEFSLLIKENRKLKEEIKQWKEKYERLKKEINYSKALFS